jgi:hypothetical protein
MNVTAVDSNTLATVAYDCAQQILQLAFRSGAVYQYSDVPVAVYVALLDAPSKGIYFNQAIRGRFPYRLISEGSADMGRNS